MALQSSQRLPELLFYTKKSYRILQLQFYKGTHPSTYNIQAPYKCTLQRILHPESNFTCRRQRALRVLLLHIEGKETFIPEKKFYAQKARRSSRNPSVCLTRPSKNIPGIPAARPSKGIPDIPVFPDIPVIHDLPAFPGNSTSSSTSRVSTPLQHSPIRMHILHILQILQFDWFPQKTPPSTS